MNAVLKEIATEIVLKKVAEDKMKEMEKEQKLKRQQENANNVKEENSDSDFELDEEEVDILRRMKEERVQSVQNNMKNKKQDIKASVWAGEYNEIKEDEFLNIVTKNKFVVCHFYHPEFQRCKVVDQHMKAICKYHQETVFITLNAEKAPFFVQKLAVKVLPTICLFKDGIMVDKIVGFEELGGDDFKTTVLARRMIRAGVMRVRLEEEKAQSLKNILGKQNAGNDSDSDCD